MHSYWARVNTTLTFFATVAFGLCAAVALTDIFHKADPQIEVSLNDVKKLAQFRGSDQAVLSLRIKADLSSAFTWNTKQLFVYVQAEYTTPQNELNQVSLWDRIIEDKDDAVIDIRALRQKYAFIDQGRNLRGLPLNVSLVWNVMPKVGMLTLHSRTFQLGGLPEEYKS